MRRTCLRKTTGLLLCVAMLLGSIVPPGQRHAHANGDVAHDHHQQNGHNHSHNNDQQHHATIQEDLHTQAFKGAAVAHVHFAFWLFQSIPPNREESDKDDNEPVSLVRLIDKHFLNTISGPETKSIEVWSALTGIAVAPTLPTGKATTPPDTSILLCDSARHERSGVQLF